METGTNDSVLVFRGYRLDPRQRRLWSPGGEPEMLRPKEFDVLLVLVRRAGSPEAKDELMAQVWPDTVVEENNLNQVISRLRQILGDDRHDPAFIATITGRGYQFVATVDGSGTGDPGEVEPADESPILPRWRWAAMAVVLAVGVILALTILQDGEAPVDRAQSGLSDAMLVTASPASNSMPTLSPDGTIMAFVSDRSGVDQIWVKGIPNGRSIQLTDGPLPASSPSWSPVSDAILFQRSAPDGWQSVWLVDALGSQPPGLVVRDAAYPRFAPDGRSFVFTRGLGEIHIGYLDGDRTRKLEGIPKTPGFADVMPAMNANGDVAFVLADEGPSGNL